MNVSTPKRFTYAILCVLLTVACLLASASLLVSCGSREPDYQSFDMYFINSFSRKDEIDRYHISGLTCYMLDDYYYYDVTFTMDDSSVVAEDEVLECLFIISDLTPENLPMKLKNVTIPYLESFFNIQNVDECYEYFESYYTNFLKAKEKGVMRTFTQDEIQKLIDDYLASPDTLY